MSLPSNQRAKSLLALAMPSLDCLETMLQHAGRLENATQDQLDIVLERIGAEIAIISTMVKTFSEACREAPMENASGKRTFHSDLHELTIPIIKRALPSIANAASNYNFNEVSCDTAFNYAFDHVSHSRMLLLKSVSESLGYFLTICLPTNANSDAAVEFIRELCTICVSIIQSESSRDTTFDSVLDFLEEFATVHGEMVDRNTRMFLQGESGTVNAGQQRERDVAKFLETLLLSTVHSINQVIGNSPSSERQGNGQPAFETKAAAKSPGRRALAMMFSLLQVCAAQCPVFLLSLPVGPGCDRRDDLLMRRVVDAAVSSLLESDVATANGAMALLESAVNLTQSVSDEIRDVVEGMLSRVRSDALTSLVVGSCGKLNSGSLDNAARLLRRMLVASPSLEENQSNLVKAIGNENVFLGIRGKEVTLEFLLQSSRNENTDEDVSKFFHAIWDLHQIETPESLPNSDAVVHFCKRYSAAS